MIMRRAALGISGLGDCPEWAPYVTTGGGCSNTPPETDRLLLSQFDDYGYSFSDAGVASYQQPVVTDSGAYAAGAGGGYDAALTAAKLEASRAEAEAKARAAEQQGSALGLNVRCSTYQNVSPGSPSLFGTDCTVNGQPGHDADLLMLPGGWNIAATSAQYAAGTPVQHLQLSTQAPPRYDYVNPQIPDTLSEIRRTVPSDSNQTRVPTPSAAVGVTDPRSGSAATAPPALQNAINGNTGVQNLLSAARGYVEPLASQASAATGLPTSTILLIGGAALLFFLSRGK